MSACEDPADFTILLLKVLAACVSVEVRFLLYFCRCFLGLCMTLAESLILLFGLDVFETAGTGVQIGALCAFMGTFIVGGSILGLLAGSMFLHGSTAEDNQRRKNKFFLTFKVINVIFTAFVTAVTVYSWETLDIKNLFNPPEAAKIFVVFSLGLDILFDPIEMVIGFCIFCRH